MFASRRKTRFALVQVLYSDVYYSWIDFSLFFEAYSDKNEFLYSDLDWEYFHSMRDIVHKNSSQLLAIIIKIASRFDVEKMPKIHIIILMIALSEICFYKHEDIHMKVSINEAVELAKTFSDDAWRKFVSWVLGTFSKNRELYDLKEQVNFSFFS